MELAPLDDFPLRYFRYMLFVEDKIRYALYDLNYDDKYTIKGVSKLKKC